jgi:arsenate reductase
LPDLAGQPIVPHWGSDDPDAVEGSDEERRKAVKKIAVEIYRRLGLFTSLPIASLDDLRFDQLTKEIGHQGTIVGSLGEQRRLCAATAPPPNQP